MADFNIEAEARTELGKNASRRLRVAGKIPAVLYGGDGESQSLSVDPDDLIQVLTSDRGRNTIFKLQVGGKPVDVLIRDYQLDPVRGTLLHSDLQRVSMDKLMEFNISVDLEGTAKGVKEGGLIDQIRREIPVECLPGDIPERISVDVTDLEIGDSLRVSDLGIPTEKVRLLVDQDATVVTIVAPQVEEEELVEEELGLEEVEPELIGRGREEEEEGGEGPAE